MRLRLIINEIAKMKRQHIGLVASILILSVAGMSLMFLPSVSRGSGVEHDLAARDGHGPTADFDVDNRPRRQELTEAQMRYRETGSLYVTRPWVYRERGNRIGGTIGLFIMDEVEGVDIDGPLDLALAGKTLIQMQQQEGLA